MRRFFHMLHSSLHKVLPSLSRSARSHQQLHTAFWNHGAASFELFDACQAILGSDMDEPQSDTGSATPTPPVKGTELMTASAFLLDFLYPRGTLSLLRKLNCSPLDRYEKSGLRFANPLARFQVAAVSNTAYLESPAPSKADDQVATHEDAAHDASEERDGNNGTIATEDQGNTLRSPDDTFAEKLGGASGGDLASKEQNKKGKQKEPVEAPTTDDEFSAFEDDLSEESGGKAAQFTRPGDSSPLESSDPANQRPGSTAEDGHIPEEKELNNAEVNEVTDPEKLRKALSRGSSAFPDHVSHLYEHLEPHLKGQYTMDVLNYLAIAPWIPEPRAFCDMTSRLDPFDWSLVLVRASIRTALTLDDVSMAIDFFQRALDKRAWPHGFDLLLTYGLTNGSWDMLLKLWGECRERLLSNDVPRVDLYSTIKTPDLSTRLTEFWEYIRSMAVQGDYGAMKEIYNSLLRYLAANAMQEVPTDAAVFMVEQLAEAVPYEELIKLSINRDDGKVASNLYRSYRKLPGVKIRIPILRQMLEVFYPNNDFGMEMILKDWYSRYDNLDFTAYVKFICFYASQGDVAAVVRLWKEFRKVYKNKAVQNKRAVRALIEVYAIRGDVKKARAVFDEINGTVRWKPDTMQYNTLLNAHRKAWDLDGAMNTFRELCNNVEPNNYSFGYLMSMSGARGDVKLTTGLYRMARNAGIAPDVIMLEAMVHAYCESDRLDAAEDLCDIATRKRLLPDKIKFSGRTTTPYTVIWNTVLKYHAISHDLTNLNRVLQRMSELKIPYDGKTYEYLLLGLVLCKQSDHALRLVEIAEERGTFEPTAEHYLLLMSAYITTREPSAVFKISRLMSARNYAESAAKMTKLMEAFGVWARLPRHDRQNLPAPAYLQAALLAFRKSLGREDRTAKDDMQSVAEQYSTIINLLAQMREFATISEIMALFESQFPAHSTPEEMPRKLLNALMSADFYENKYDRVMETWDVVFDRAVSLGKSASADALPDAQQDPSKVSPGYRFILNKPLSIIFKIHSATGDVESLVGIVDRFRRAGFRMSGQNWNIYIQILARHGRWMDAFELCEQVLMPAWSGWARRRIKDEKKVRLPLDVRRLGSSFRYARPNTHTLLVLIRQFMELERMAPWSGEQAALLEKVSTRCQRFVRAAKTMMPSGSDLEAEILGEDVLLAGLGDVDGEILRRLMKDDEYAALEESPWHALKADDEPDDLNHTG